MSTPTKVAVEPGTYKIDPVHSQVAFEIEHLGIATFRGRFRSFDGVLRFGEDGRLEAAEGEIDVRSVDVQDEMLSQHLLSDEFFAAETFPTARFRSTAIEPVGDDRYRVRGDFELKGRTNEVALDARVKGAARDLQGKLRVSVAAEGEIDRHAWGIDWDHTLEGGVKVIGDKVRLLIEIEAQRQ